MLSSQLHRSAGRNRPWSHAHHILTLCSHRVKATTDALIDSPIINDNGLTPSRIEGQSDRPVIVAALQHVCDG